MKTFKEFLEEKEPEILASRERNARDRDDWIRAVEELFDLIKTWLAESDPKELLSFSRRMMRIQEQKFGDYVVPVMTIWLEGNYVEIRPVGRFVRGPMTKPEEGEWTGWVEISNGETDVGLLRLTAKSNKHAWFIRTYNNNVMLMTKESLEQILISLLS